jgi:hypothetical protein
VARCFLHPIRRLDPIPFQMTSTELDGTSASLMAVPKRSPTPWLLPLLLLIGGAREAAAARLAYEVPAAGDHRCPSRARFAGEVSARLGFSPWSSSGARLRVRIEAKDAGFVGSIAPGAARVERRKTFAADSCRKVADLLVTATAITLDRMEPSALERRGAAAPTGGELAGLDGMPSARQTIEQWSFAERNNRYQLGLMATSIGAWGLTGNVPLGPGHLQATYARTSDDSDFGESTVSHAHAYYLLPVFHLNRDSRFEVPIFAGGGLGYQSYDHDQMTGMDVSESKMLPTLAAGFAIQFRAFPVEFQSQMTLSLVEPPLTEQRIGYNFAFRYVFGQP